MTKAEHSAKERNYALQIVKWVYILIVHKEFNQSNLKTTYA